jgi:hypothetical protein
MPLRCEEEEEEEEGACLTLFSKRHRGYTSKYP